MIPHLMLKISTHLTPLDMTPSETYLTHAVMDSNGKYAKMKNVFVNIEIRPFSVLCVAMPLPPRILTTTHLLCHPFPLKSILTYLLDLMVTSRPPLELREFELCLIFETLSNT